jgi:hypothetical protein
MNNLNEQLFALCHKKRLDTFNGTQIFNATNKLIMRNYRIIDVQMDGTVSQSLIHYSRQLAGIHSVNIPIIFKKL